MNDNIKELLNRAESGDCEAQNQLGDCYYNGDGVEKNDAEAFRWYESSAWGGSMWGKFNYGKCFRLGIGVAQDSERARHEFRLSAKMGNPRALQQLAELGDSEAMFKLGDYYFNGNRKDWGPEQNDGKAFEWYQKSADKGDSWGYFNVAKCYWVGRGTTRDRAQAIQYFKKSADAGNETSANWLSLAQTQGEAALTAEMKKDGITGVDTDCWDLNRLKMEIAIVEQKVNNSKELPHLLSEKLSALKRSLRQFESPVTVIASVGMLKAGKSTLVNLFAGSDLASPIGFGKDMTLRPALIRMADKGTDSRIVCYFLGAADAEQKVENVRLSIFDYYRRVEAQLPQCVYAKTFSLTSQMLYDCLCRSCSENTELTREPVLVVVETPYRETPCLLSGQCMLLDMPGLDSGHAELVAKRGFLRVVQECDIILFVQSSVSPLNAAATGILKQIFSDRNSETAQIVHNEMRAKTWLRQVIQDEEQRTQANQACQDIKNCISYASAYQSPQWNCVNLGMAFDAVFGHEENLNDRYVFDDGTPLSREELRKHSHFFEFQKCLQESMAKRGAQYRFLHCKGEFVRSLRELHNKLKAYMVADLAVLIKQTQAETENWQMVRDEVDLLMSKAAFGTKINTASLVLSARGESELNDCLDAAVWRAHKAYPETEQTQDDEVKGSRIDAFLDRCSANCCKQLDDWRQNHCRRADCMVTTTSQESLWSILRQELDSFFASVKQRREVSNPLSEFYSQLPMPQSTITEQDLMVLPHAITYQQPPRGNYPFTRKRRYIWGLITVETGYRRKSFAAIPGLIKNRYRELMVENIKHHCEDDMRQVYQDGVKKGMQEMRKAIDSRLSDSKQREKQLQEQLEKAQELSDSLEKLGNGVRALSMQDASLHSAA